MNGRGPPMGAMAAGAGAGMMAGEMGGRGQRGPPPGYHNGYPPQGRGGPGYYSRDNSPGPNGAPGAYARRRPSPGPPGAPGFARQGSSPGGYGVASNEVPPMPPVGAAGMNGGQRSPAPMPIMLPDEGVVGQAIEMDATTGSPSYTPGFAPHNQLRDSDADVQGMVALQQNRHDSMPRSPTSTYSGEQ